jgi:excisionase family DNA binding protein
MHMQALNQQQRILELELQQARYEAGLAELRYAACDPDNRLIAAQLEKSWESARRVSSVRREHGIHAYRSAEKNSEWLTMSEAAKLLSATNHAIRRLIKERILPAEQVVPDAPYQIRASDLESEAVAAAIARKYRPCRIDADRQLPMFIGTSERGAQ